MSVPSRPIPARPFTADFRLIQQFRMASQYILSNEASSISQFPDQAIGHLKACCQLSTCFARFQNNHACVCLRPSDIATITHKPTGESVVEPDVPDEDRWLWAASCFVELYDSGVLGSLGITPRTAAALAALTAQYTNQTSIAIAKPTTPSALPAYPSDGGTAASAVSLRRLVLIATGCLYGDISRNAWIVKPNKLSKGKGIRVFGAAVKALRYAQDMKFQAVLQKYVERPLTVFGRKVRVRPHPHRPPADNSIHSSFRHESHIRLPIPCRTLRPTGFVNTCWCRAGNEVVDTNVAIIAQVDIRQWVLVTQLSPLTVWIFNSAYVRICGVPYMSDRFDNAMAHLCNQSVQNLSFHGAHATETAHWGEDEEGSGGGGGAERGAVETEHASAHAQPVPGMHNLTWNSSQLQLYLR